MNLKPSFGVTFSFLLGACAGGAIIFKVVTYKSPEEIALDHCAKEAGVYSCAKVFVPAQEPRIVIAQTKLLPPPVLE